MSQHRVFFSFHYERDACRVAQVRERCAAAVISNDPESVKLNSFSSIERWIDRQLKPVSCTVVLIGSETAHRNWIDYEIAKSWNDGKGILGIYVHGLRDRYGRQSSPGTNPFDKFVADGLCLSDVVKTYDPWCEGREDMYNHINCHIDDWVDDAIMIRRRYPEAYATAS